MIEEVGHKVGLFICHGRMTGKTEFLSTYLLGDGQ